MRTPRLSERRSQGAAQAGREVRETKVWDGVRLLTNAKGKEWGKLVTREAS